MANKESEVRFVGPVMKAGEIGEAVLDAIREDNAGREIQVEEHASYVRIKVRGECCIRLATVREMLGRELPWSEVEANMPSFEGFIRTGTDQIVFLSN
jgi:toluene monooxygenase system protein D